MSGLFWRDLPDGLEICVRATPKAGRDRIDGVMQDASGAVWLSVRVSAVPDGGRANDSIVKLLATHFDVRQRDVVLASGTTARLKRFRIYGDSGQLGRLAASFQEV